MIRSHAASIGYPVHVKAAAGGGGKGMRVVQSEKELAASLDAAQREANAAFGDGRVFLEKYISRPRHVEFQIFGDAHGNVVHLFERECSIQRRHQKIIEESPSPALTPQLRQKMGEAAVRAAKAIGYTNAGTVEFMLDDSGNFYFLEVNTRLQVEHPVTEMITHQDLVGAQILVAAGEKLPFTQDQLQQDGHAIECRIYAEDPSHGFLPSTGVLEHYVPPAGPNVRIDSGVAEGAEVSVYYDPMLAKLITWGRDRNESIARMNWALRHYVVLGVTTNIPFLRAVIQHPDFLAGKLHTQFLEQNRITTDEGDLNRAIIAAALALNQNASPAGRLASFRELAAPGPWSSGAWRAC
jgi:acetyl/propionyl-CoA carboxylase alpha subunit